MTNPITPERWAELRGEIAKAGPYVNPVVAELAGEVDRLSAKLAEEKRRHERYVNGMRHSYGEEAAMLRNNIGRLVDHLGTAEKERGDARAEAARHLEALRTAHPQHFKANVLGERMCGCPEGQWPCLAETDQVKRVREVIADARARDKGLLARRDSFPVDSRPRRKEMEGRAYEVRALADLVADALDGGEATSRD